MKTSGPGGAVARGSPSFQKNAQPAGFPAGRIWTGPVPPEARVSLSWEESLYTVLSAIQPYAHFSSSAMPSGKPWVAKK